jgi:hypothetical protein
MITLKDWMQISNYRVSEGSEYGWECFGPNAYRLDAWNGDQNGHSHSVVFDTKTQEVYEVTTYDYRNNRAYRLMNPEWVKEFKDEAQRREVEFAEAWDDVHYVDLDVEEDFLEKARAIEAGEDYDTRVQLQITFPDDELLLYMKIAHDRDITFNELVEIALQDAIDQHRMINDIPFPVKQKKKKKHGKKQTV